MPPTDLMKILSRADQLKKDFLMFLKELGFIKEIRGGILNVFPHTTSIIIGRDLLRCLGMSFCIDEKRGITSFSSNMLYHNSFVIEFPRKAELVCLESNSGVLCKVHNTLGTFSVYQREGLRNLIIATANLLKTQRLAPSASEKLRSTTCGIKAFTAVSSSGLALTIAFDDLGELITLGKNYMELEHYGNYMYVSSEGVVPAIRRAIVEKSVIVLNTSINQCMREPLIEVVDNYTLLVPWALEGNCINMVSLNFIDEAVNTAIKIYKGFITKVSVDGVEHEYRHRMIRIALAPYASAYVKLCLASDLHMEPC